MWAILGDIKIDALESPDSYEHTSAVEYKSHDLIGVKPSLEMIGSSADTISITVQLHAGNTDVTAREKQLRDAMLTAEPLHFVLGNGDYKGLFVITDLAVSIKKTFSDGTPWVASVAISLLEFSGEVSTPIPQGIRSDAPPFSEEIPVPQTAAADFSCGMKNLSTAIESGNAGYALSTCTKLIDLDYQKATTTLLSSIGTHLQNADMLGAQSLLDQAMVSAITVIADVATRRI